VHDPSLLQAKAALRERMKMWRAGLHHAFVSQAAEAVAAQGLDFLQASTRLGIVSGFSSLPEEFRVWPLLRRLHHEGIELAMPAIQGKDRPLKFRAWSPGDAMARGVWGIAEPQAGKAELEPDILLVPLLAFDASGWRLGYGGGYYDRTLHTLRAHKRITAVGLGYDEQRVDAVPHLDYDERLDFVLTPSGVLRCAG
jgi:5-formyltetrahydrofolate cyclo-ligase